MYAKTRLFAPVPKHKKKIVCFPKSQIFLLVGNSVNRHLTARHKVFHRKQKKMPFPQKYSEAIHHYLFIYPKCLFCYGEWLCCVWGGGSWFNPPPPSLLKIKGSRCAIPPLDLAYFFDFFGGGMLGLFC